MQTESNYKENPSKLAMVRPALVILTALTVVIVGASGSLAPEHLANFAGLFMGEVIKSV